MASRREYEMLFKLSAQLGGGYSSTFKSAQSTIVSMQKEIDALNKTQSDVAAYQKQQASIEATGKKLEVLRQQYDNIQKEISETGTFSAELQNKLLAKQMQIDKTTASFNAQTSRLEQYSATLKNAGINTDDLSGESAQLENQIESLKQRQEDAADGASTFGSKASMAFGIIKQAVVAAGIVKALQEIYEYFNSCTDAAMEFESAMTGVAKTTDLTDAEFAAMSESVQKLSTEIPATTTELAAIAETAGQLGIAKNSLLDFTEIMAMLGTATNMTSDEAATMLAQFASITGMDPAYYSNLGSTIVDLGNNFATTERNIADMSQTIAAAGSISGMSEADITAIAAAVTSLGITAQNGGTQMTKLISDINSAVSSGEGLSDWASVAGTSASSFSEAWGKDAANALDLFIQGLNETYEAGGDVYGVLSDLGITETRMVTMITSLAKSGDRLTDTLHTANSAWSENTALTTEAEKRYATAQSELVLMQNAYNNLSVTIGEQFAPELQSLHKLGAEVFGDLADFVKEHPAAVKALTVLALELGSIVAVTLTYNAAKKVSNTLKAIGAVATAAETAAMTTEAAATKGATAATVAFNSALNINPVILATTAIIALTAGIVALSEASEISADESAELTASSREQYEELQKLTKEYEKAQGLYDENSTELVSLRYEVDTLTKTYEVSNQTLKAFIAETEALVDTHNQTISSYQEATSAINSEEQGVLTLIYKLKELGSKTALTAGEQEQMKTIIDALNGSVPDLALNYDDATQSLNMSADAIEKMVKAQAEQERQAEKHRAWVDLMKEQSALEEQLADAEENLQRRRKELMDEGAIVDSPIIGWSTDLDDYIDQYEEINAAYKENEAMLAEISAQAETYAAAQANAADGSRELQDSLSGVTSQAQALADAYSEAYTAALESMQGQYDLWDKAADVVATSAGTINSNLQGQISYWQQYNENLDNLNSRSADIEGLGQMIASFADGSSDSVNAIAGMANASDSDLQKMVENWQRLQEEQKTAAGSFADLETDFTNSMEALKHELNITVSEMDLGEKAAQSGKDTIKGFIDGAEDMLPSVQAAYKHIADTAIAAIDEQLQIHSPSRVMMEKAEMTWDGYINQTEAMEPDVAAAMAYTSNAGVEALSSQEAQLVTLAPQLMAYLGARHDAIPAEIGSASGDTGVFSPVFNVTYNVSGGNPEGVVSGLEQFTSNLQEFILEVVENERVNATRRAYR